MRSEKDTLRFHFARGSAESAAGLCCHLTSVCAGPRLLPSTEMVPWAGPGLPLVAVYSGWLPMNGAGRVGRVLALAPSRFVLSFPHTRPVEPGPRKGSQSALPRASCVPPRLVQKKSGR